MRGFFIPSPQGNLLVQRASARMSATGGVSPPQRGQERFPSLNVEKKGLGHGVCAPQDGHARINVSARAGAAVTLDWTNQGVLLVLTCETKIQSLQAVGRSCHVPSTERTPTALGS